MMIIFFDRDFWAIAAAKPVLKRAFKVAIIVGIILNLINQWDAIFGASPFNLVKGLLTFCVPFCVSAYSAASIQLEQLRRAAAE